jgi:protein phosphatase
VPTVRLRDPSLVVLVGAAGSGKSTLAARHFDPDEILSSDSFRAAISGDEADQRASRAAFGRLHRALERRLAAGRSSVVDATNLTRHARQALLTRAAAANVSTVAIVLDLPPPIVRARNVARATRVVDATVVDRHLASLRETLDAGAIAVEGFDVVVILVDAAQVDALRIERLPQT